MKSLVAALMAAGTAVAWAPGAWSEPEAPILASPAQATAEGLVLKLLGDPEIKAAQAQLEAQLAATPRGQTPAGAARIKDAVDEWTASVAFKEATEYLPAPAFLWVTDDTPRSWYGHTLPGVGVSGDNPDNIYRETFLDGAGRYEVTGQVDLAHRPSQFSFQFDRGDGLPPVNAQKSYGGGLGTQVGMVTDRDLAIGPDGSFRFTINGPDDGPGHVTLPPGQVLVGVRDSLSDWRQKPTRLSIRRLDPVAAKPYDYAALRQAVLADLPHFVAFWSVFPDKWIGGIGPNAVGGPIARDGGWGFVAGVHYKLQPGEGLLVRTTDGGAKYTGFQVCDTWMVAPDAKRFQTSLNNAQARRDGDGGFTYVISPEDPGVANWLETGGIYEGYAVLRWQAVPPGLTKDGLVRELKVVRLSDLAALPGVARTSPDERKAQLAARAQGYASRAR
jgi:hypothetical protein